jgi:hypothetical protein
MTVLLSKDAPAQASSTASSASITGNTHCVYRLPHDPSQSSAGVASQMGAKAASALPAARLRTWEDGDDAAVHASVLLSPPNDLFNNPGAGYTDRDGLWEAGHLMRIVRPMAGDVLDRAAAHREPATLQINVSAVTFDDHPLFSREDRRVQYNCEVALLI